MHLAKSSRVAGVAGGALIAILALTGCGGSSHAASAGTTTTTQPAGGNGSRGAALSAFRSCMTSHGVTLPQRPRGSGNRTPGSSRPRGNGQGFGLGAGGFFNQPPPGVDATKYQDALNACRSTLPNGGNFRNNSAFQAYRSCLQDHGVTIPAQGSAGSINRNDPKVQAAMKTCAPLLPQGFGRRSTTTTAPPTS